MGDWYVREIVDTGKQPLAVLLVAFVVTFLFIRLSVRMIRRGVSWWPGNVTPKGVHIHHEVFGVVFMIIAGIGGFTGLGESSPWSEIFAGLFGCGAALVLDEFALLLRLDDVYWSEQGRLSVDAVFLAIAAISLILLGVSPFGVGDDPDETAWGLVATVALNGAFVLITLVKGKIWTGLLGILVPGLALVGAVRLARPASPWARWRYRPDSRKARRAERRDRRFHAWLVRQTQAVQNVIAGRPST